MKKVFFSWILLAISLTVSAQGNSGLGFNYQAVVRGANGLVLSAQEVELRFSLAQGQHFTPECWVETRSVRTDDFGTVGVRIGNGTKSGGTAEKFEDVNFAIAQYWLKVEIKDGAEFKPLSHSALASVPYAEAAHNGAPIGSVMPFAGDKVPDGWLLCDGSEVNISDYPALFDVIRMAWGGDGTTKFRVPDMRGMFLRGVSGTSTKTYVGDPNNTTHQVDPNRANRMALNTGGNTGNSVGSFEGDAIRNIMGNISAIDSDLVLFRLDSNRGHIPSGSLWGFNSYYFDASRVVPTGSDNRPQNVYVHYIIKY